MCELILLYWHIGREILRRQREEGWGGKVIDRLAADLRRSFPEVTGFSRRNLHYMRSLAEAYPDQAFVQQAVAQIPWGHNTTLLDAVKDPAERAWYIQKTSENGWSRNVLVHQVESSLYRRQGKALDNFAQLLPPPDSDLTRHLLKDPYNFDFLTLTQRVQERELHRGLVAHIREFLLELGKGFAYVGSEYPLDVQGRDYQLDLLFYHLHLRCFVVIELKPGEFEPEYAGKMNFYLSAVDDQLRHAADGPSIGIILCKSRNRLIVEYALRDLNKPMSVSEYLLNLVPELPAPLSGSLPTVEELEGLEAELEEGGTEEDGEGQERSGAKERKA
jgi:predicted nuclease of restriction endonuclease-like (RecB) superfamily